jgi:hypothetical protein
MKRYAVTVKCTTPLRPVRQAYGDSLRTDVLVFAGSPEQARVAAVEKMRDKWLRHQDLKTDWIARKATVYETWEEAIERADRAEARLKVLEALLRRVRNHILPKEALPDLHAEIQSALAAAEKGK